MDGWINHDKSIYWTGKPCLFLSGGCYRFNIRQSWKNSTDQDHDDEPKLTDEATWKPLQTLQRDYPLVIKHGNAKWSIFHCHVWLPDGVPASSLISTHSVLSSVDIPEPEVLNKLASLQKGGNHDVNTWDIIRSYICLSKMINMGCLQNLIVDHLFQTYSK